MLSQTVLLSIISPKTKDKNKSVAKICRDATNNKKDSLSSYCRCLFGTHLHFFSGWLICIFFSNLRHIFSRPFTSFFEKNNFWGGSLPLALRFCRIKGGPWRQWVGQTEGFFPSFFSWQRNQQLGEQRVTIAYNTNSSHRVRGEDIHHFLAHAHPRTPSTRTYTHSHTFTAGWSAQKFFLLWNCRRQSRKNDARLVNANIDETDRERERANKRSRNLCKTARK